jgi:uncharacterized metal-binding protein (TIGR02443 family)
MKTKRFIAGAICPSCKKLDKVTLQRDVSFQILECVACGHTQKQALNDDNNLEKSVK